MVENPRFSSSVVVVGVTPDSSIEVTNVDISDTNRPVIQRLYYWRNATWWTPNSEKLCVLHPRDAWSTNIPSFYMRQFGTEQNYMTDILVNGEVYLPYYMEPTLSSPKLYNITGEFMNHQWMPAPDALLSIGTYSPATDLPVLGKLTVFDASGTRGVVYSTVSSHEIAGSGDKIQTLTAPVEVNMNNITLTKAVYSIAMGTTGYIIDEAPDHSTILYSITLNSTAIPTLYPVTVNGSVPEFIPGRAVTTMGSSKLVLFGGLRDGTPTSLFHVFDTSARTWSGPNLVSPYVPGSTPTKTNNIAAIVGGVVGGVVLLALLSFFGFRR
ncbi:hypothetical protein BGW41_003714 [Actinomortierella wolfii]|nr:hypothetical protein BGW41_003714 [Actinomortierella wolfii]